MARYTYTLDITEYFKIGDIIATNFLGFIIWIVIRY